MSNQRITFNDDNMDLLMYLVRKWDTNPSNVINELLTNPKQIIDARSELYEKQAGLACKKWGKK